AAAPWPCSAGVRWQNERTRIASARGAAWGAGETGGPIARLLLMKLAPPLLRRAAAAAALAALAAACKPARPAGAAAPDAPERRTPAQVAPAAALAAPAPAPAPSPAPAPAAPPAPPSCVADGAPYGAAELRARVAL